MPNLLINESLIIPPRVPDRPLYDEHFKRKPFVSEEQLQRHFGVEESRRVLYEERKNEECRRVLYEERNGVEDNRRGGFEERKGVEEGRRGVYEERKEARSVRLPVQPVLPPKPKSRESMEREITMR